jgi:hypothetical protein
MITGYYILDRALKDKQVLVDYTKKILKIYLLCILLYLPINIYMGSFKNIDIITILKDVFINGTLYHLWYFPALIVGVWITYYLVKKLGRKKALIATILLYIIGVFGDSYYGITIMNQITKNIYKFIYVFLCKKKVPEKSGTTCPFEIYSAKSRFSASFSNSFASLTKPSSRLSGKRFVMLLRLMPRVDIL